VVRLHARDSSPWREHELQIDVVFDLLDKLIESVGKAVDLKHGRDNEHAQNGEKQDEIEYQHRYQQNNL
jgi:hypothetical protein